VNPSSSGQRRRRQRRRRQRRRQHPHPAACRCPNNNGNNHHHHLCHLTGITSCHSRAARLWEWKHNNNNNDDGDRHSLPLLHKKQVQKQRQQQQRYLQQQRHHRRWGRSGGNGNDSLSTTTTTTSPTVDAATPTILIVEPSRELARQVGKVFEKFHPMTATAAAVASAAKGGSSSSGSRRSITVYGGVPMTRHASMLSSQTQVVVGNPRHVTSPYSAAPTIHTSCAGGGLAPKRQPTLSISTFRGKRE